MKNIQSNTVVLSIKKHFQSFNTLEVSFFCYIVTVFRLVQTSDYFYVVQRVMLVLKNHIVQ